MWRAQSTSTIGLLMLVMAVRAEPTEPSDYAREEVNQIEPAEHAFEEELLAEASGVRSQRSFITPPPRGLLKSAVRVRRSCQRALVGRASSAGALVARVARSPRSLASLSRKALRPAARLLARRGWLVATPLCVAGRWRSCLLALSLAYVSVATLQPALELRRLGGACAAPTLVLRAVSRAAAFQAVATFALPSALLRVADWAIRVLQPAAGASLADWAVPLAAPLALLLSLPHLDAPTEEAVDAVLRRVWPTRVPCRDAGLAW